VRGVSAFLLGWQGFFFSGRYLLRVFFVLALGLVVGLESRTHGVSSELAGFLFSGRCLLCVFFVLAPDLVGRLSVFRVDGVGFCSACFESSRLTCLRSGST
jgi:hypothetical protein